MQKENSEEEIGDAITFVGLPVGVAIGLVPIVTYQTATKEQKINWDKERVMHHGLFGLIVVGISLIGCLMSDDPRIRKLANFGMSVGVGIALSDIADGDRWFTEGKIFR